MKIGFTIAALAIAALGMSGQSPAKPEKPAKPPVITELQGTKLEDYEAQMARIFSEANAAAQPWREKRLAVIQEILAANPGYQWHEAQGPNDHEGLVPPPAPPAPAPAKPAPPSPATPEKK